MSATIDVSPSAGAAKPVPARPSVEPVPGSDANSLGVVSLGFPDADSVGVAEGVTVAESVGVAVGEGVVCVGVGVGVDVVCVGVGVGVAVVGVGVGVVGVGVGVVGVGVGVRVGVGVPGTAGVTVAPLFETVKVPT